jgi:hypothetical protein
MTGQHRAPRKAREPRNLGGLWVLLALFVLAIAAVLFVAAGVLMP